MQQHVEMIADVPIPMTQEETVHAPTIANHHRHHHEHVEQTVDIEVEHNRKGVQKAMTEGDCLWRKGAFEEAAR
eukprot:7159053-Heterocapsa_arctica.AAC.1